MSQSQKNGSGSSAASLFWRRIIITLCAKGYGYFSLSLTLCNKHLATISQLANVNETSCITSVGRVPSMFCQSCCGLTASAQLSMCLTSLPLSGSIDEKEKLWGREKVYGTVARHHTGESGQNPSSKSWWTGCMLLKNHATLLIFPNFLLYSYRE